MSAAAELAELKKEMAELESSSRMLEQELEAEINKVGGHRGH